MEQLQQYDFKQKSKNIFTILTSRNRQEVLEEVASQNNWQYINKPTWLSSMGYVLTDTGQRISVKDPARSGDGSPGIRNENVFHDECAKYAGQYNHIKFEHDNGSFTIENVFSVVKEKYQRGSRKKADIVIDHFEGQFKINIKKNCAEIWESCDSYDSASVKKVIDNAIKNERIILDEVDGLYRAKNEIAWYAKNYEKRDFVFGSDIEDNGAIVFNTFSEDDFKVIDDTLHINVSRMIFNLNELSEEETPMFLVRNDKTRASAVLGYPGLRVLSVMQKRINKNTEIV